MEVSEESIRINHPIPPLPKFDLKNNPEKPKSQNVSSMSLDLTGIGGSKSFLGASNQVIEYDNYSINDDELKKYTALYEKNKDSDRGLSMAKAYDMWNVAKIPIDKVQKILSIVPLKDKASLNFTEFKVVFHLIYKTYQSEVPNTLPNSLQLILNAELSTNTNPNKGDFDFSNKLGVNLNLNGPSYNSGIMNTSMPNVNKSVDIESALLNEFNMKPVVNIQNEPLNLTSANNSNFISPNLNTGNTKQFIQSNVDKMTNIYNNSVEENQFLNKIYDEDSSLLRNLMEDVEKINRNISSITDKNKQLRDQILDIRRRINIERDNLSKAATTLNNKSNELIKNQGKIK